MASVGFHTSIGTIPNPSIVGAGIADAMATADAGGNGKPAKAKAPPRLPKPDRPAFEARVAEIQAQCDAAQAEIDAIKTRIDAKKNGRRIDENGAKPTKNKLQEVRDQFKAVLVRAKEERCMPEPRRKPRCIEADACANTGHRARKTQKRTAWPPWKRQEKVCVAKSR